MPRSDVLVCGSGPAGVTVANLHKTEKVTVLDPNPFYKPCGELVLQREAHAMGAEVMRRASYVEVRTPYGSREFRAETAMIDKAAWLEKALEHSGAELVRTLARRPLTKAGSCVGVEADADYTAAITYDCTGAARALASRFGAASEREFAVCYEETVRDTGEFDVPLAYYDERIAPGGYFWLFPRGDGTAYLGLAVWPWVSSVRERLRLFSRRIGLSSDAVLSRKGSRIFMGLPRQPPVKGLLVVGEANGSCDPFTGSGIFQAITDARKQVLGERRRSGSLRKLSAFALRNIPAAYLQALEAMPVPFVQFCP